MRYSLFLLLIALSIVSSCKKKIVEMTPVVYLEEPHIIGDSVKLTWTVSNIEENSRVYMHVRRKTYPEQDRDHEDKLGSDGYTYYDVPPPTGYFSYQIEVEVHGNDHAGNVGFDRQFYYSQVREYKNPNITNIGIDPLDVLYDYDNNQVYFFGANGTIAKYDVNGANVALRVSTDSLWFPDMALHNGQREIYVPKQNGHVDIYNSSLQKIDEINVGSPVYSVAYSNGYLYTTSESAGSNLKYGRPLFYNVKVYNRDNKQLVSNSNNTTAYGCAVIKKVPGSSAELIGVNVSPSYYASEYESVEFYSFKYGSGGTFISTQTEIPQGHTGNSLNLVIAPDGNRFITTIAGHIYNKDFTYVTQLATTPDSIYRFCTGFGFNGNSELYVGRPDRTLDVLSPTDFHRIKKLKTVGYPFRVFFDDNNIITVNKTGFEAINIFGVKYDCLVQVL